MSKERTPVAICVSTFDRNGPLTRLLEHLLAVADFSADSVKLGIAIADDNTDGRAKAVADAFADRFELGIRYVPVNAQNISLARNASLAAGGEIADFVVLTDDDCMPPKSWLSELLAMQLSTDADIVTGPFELVAAEGSPDWYFDQGLEGASVVYADGSIPPHGCTANALIRTGFLAAHPDVRFRTDYGKTGGEDMVFFHSAEVAGAVHRYARNAMMQEDLPLERTTMRFAVGKNFWFGNNMVVINSTTKEFPSWRMFLRGLKAAIVSLSVPLKRVAGGKPPHARKAIVDSMIGFGLMAGAAGIKVNHR